MGADVGAGDARWGIGEQPSLRVFGEPTLVTARGPVVVVGHAGRLLAALAARPRGMTIDELIEALWPDGQPKTARSALHVHLTRLRRLLEDAGGSVREIAVVRQGACYRLDAGGATIDTQLFEALRRRARPLVRVAPSEAADLMERALALATGPAFVVGGDSVVPSATSQLELARLDLEEQYVEALVGASRLQEAERIALDLVNAEPYREHRWAALMRVQARQGRRADALSTFRRARIEFVNGLGLEPGEELQRTQRAVLAGEAGALEASTVGDADDGGLPPPSLVALIGRAVDLDRAERTLASAGTLLLLGAPGVGKTRLAAEIAFRAAETIDVSWVDLRGAEFADAMTVDSAVRWARRHPGGLTVFDNAEADPVVAAGLVRAVRRVAPNAPVVVTSRVSIGIESAAMVLQPLSLSAPAGVGTPDASAGAPEPAAVELLRALLTVRTPGADVPADTLTELVHLVGGLPLGLRLVADLARVVAPGELASRAGGLVVDELSPSVRALLEQIGDDARRAIAALSVVPGRLDTATVEALTDHDVGGKVIGALHDAGLLQFDASSPDAPYSMLEPIRDVAASILDELGDRTEVLDRLTDECVRRSQTNRLPTATEPLESIANRLQHDLPLHRQVMAHLAAQGRDEPALRLAANLESGLYLVGRWQAATELQSAALAIDGPPSRLRALAHVVRGRPGPLHLMDASDQQAASDMAELVGDVETRARALCYLGVRAWWDGDHALALNRLQQARQLADASTSLFAQIDIERFEGVVLVTAGEVDRGLAAQRSALERAEAEPGMAPLVPHLRMYLGHCRRAIGDIDAAVVDLEVACEEFEQASNVASLIHVYAGLAELAADRGDDASARSLSLRGLELATSGGRFEYDGWLACTLARACAAAGDVPGARAAAGEAVAGVRRGWVGETHRVAAELASVAHVIGDAAAVARLIGLAQVTPDRRELPFVTPNERERMQLAHEWALDVLGEAAQRETELGAGSTLAEAAARLVSAR